MKMGGGGFHGSARAFPVKNKRLRLISQEKNKEVDCESVGWRGTRTVCRT